MKRTEYIKVDATGNIKEGENNDCTVRALCNVTGISYEEAFVEMQKAGRQANEGITIYDFLPVYLKYGIEPVARYGTTNMSWHFMNATSVNAHEKGCTVGRMISMIKNETLSAEYDYVIMTKKHVFSVVEKKVLDKDILNASRSVVGLFRFRSKKPRLKID